MGLLMKYANTNLMYMFLCKKIQTRFQLLSHSFVHYCIRHKNKTLYHHLWILFLNNIKLKWTSKIMIKAHAISDLPMYISLTAVYDFNDELGTGKLTWDTEGEVLPTGHLYNVFQLLHFLGGLVRGCVPMTKLSHNIWTTLYILSKDKTKTI